MVLGVCLLYACGTSVRETRLVPTAPVSTEDSRTGRIADISVAARNACAVDDDGRVHCWGKLASDERPGLAHAVGGLRDIRKVVTDDLHRCAIDRRQRLWCWGDNRYGVLGPPGTGDANAVVQIFPEHRIVDVSLNLTTTCAVTDAGAVLCIGTPADRDQPMIAPRAVRGVVGAVAVELGRLRGCVMGAAGGVCCWGWDVAGEYLLGDDDERDEIASGEPPDKLCPTGSDDDPGDDADNDADDDADDAGDADDTIRGINTAYRMAGVERAVDIAVGDDFVCALRADGTALCSGDKLPHAKNLPLPLNTEEPEVITGIRDAVAINADEDHLCAILDNRTVTCWGNNQFGQFDGYQSTDRADRTDRGQGKPVAIAGLRDVRAVSVASDAGCALTTSGRAFCWGHNRSGKFGVTRPVPRFHVVAGVTARRLMLSDRFSCAVTPVGDTRCWGRFGNPLQRRGALAQSRPTAMPVIPAKDLQTLVGSAVGRCALQTDGSMRCWSQYDRGDEPTVTVESPDVVQLVSTLAGMACARARSGLVSCWGRTLGHLGDGVSTRSRMPIPVAGIAGALDIAVSASYGCAVERAGALSCWGRFRRVSEMRAGEVTIPARTRGGPRYANAPPTRVPGIDDAASVAGNESIICVRSRDQRVRCWHRDRELPPGRDMGLRDVAELAATAQELCARTFAGRVWCWDPADLRPDVEAAGLPEPGPYPRPLVELRAGHAHLCGRRANGRVVCWGENDEAQLGALPSTIELAPTRAFPLPGDDGIPAPNRPDQ